jgi:hypothetical protein
MFTLTESAGAYLARILAEAEIPQDGNLAVRLFLSRRGINLTLDEPRHADAKFGHQGAIVLVIDENLARGLEDKSLEIESTAQGNRLVLL